MSQCGGWGRGRGDGATSNGHSPSLQQEREDAPSAVFKTPACGRGKGDVCPRKTPWSPHVVHARGGLDVVPSVSQSPVSPGGQGRRWRRLGDRHTQLRAAGEPRGPQSRVWRCTLPGSTSWWGVCGDSIPSRSCSNCGHARPGVLCHACTPPVYPLLSSFLPLPRPGQHCPSPTPSTTSSLVHGRYLVGICAKKG